MFDAGFVVLRVPARVGMHDPHFRRGAFSGDSWKNPRPGYTGTSYNSHFGRAALRCFYLSFILSTRPSEKTTFPVFPPENPTGAPFLDRGRVIVIWSPGLIELLFQPFLCRMPGL